MSWRGGGGHILYLELKEEKVDCTVCDQQGAKQMHYHQYSRYETFTVYSNIYTVEECRYGENYRAKISK